MIEMYKYTHEFYTVNQDLLQMDNNRATRGHPFKLKKIYSKVARVSSPLLQPESV